MQIFWGLQAVYYGIVQVENATETGKGSGLVGHIGPYADFTLFYLWHGDHSESQPAKNMSEENASMERKKQHIDNVLERFLNYHAFHLGVTVDGKV